MSSEDSLRIDKYLKHSLIFKTRNLAEKALKIGDIMVNGKKAKPSTKIKKADIIEVNFPNSTVKYEVLELHKKSVPKLIAKESYKILSTTEKETFF